MPERNYTVAERLAAVEKTTKSTNEIVGKLEQAIYGNGKPGLACEVVLSGGDVVIERLSLFL